MPRFFFDVLEHGDVTSDNGGLEFDSRDAAEHEAARCAAEIRRDQFPKGHTQEVTVHVRDEDGIRFSLRPFP